MTKKKASKTKRSARRAGRLPGHVPATLDEMRAALRDAADAAVNKATARMAMRPIVAASNGCLVCGETRSPAVMFDGTPCLVCEPQRKTLRPMLATMMGGRDTMERDRAVAVDAAKAARARLDRIAIAFRVIESGGEDVATAPRTRSRVEAEREIEDLERKIRNLEDDLDSRNE